MITCNCNNDCYEDYGGNYYCYQLDCNNRCYEQCSNGTPDNGFDSLGGCCGNNVLDVLGNCCPSSNLDALGYCNGTCNDPLACGEEVLGCQYYDIDNNCCINTDKDLANRCISVGNTPVRDPNGTDCASGSLDTLGYCYGSCYNVVACGEDAYGNCIFRDCFYNCGGTYNTACSVYGSCGDFTIYAGDPNFNCTADDNLCLYPIDECHYCNGSCSCPDCGQGCNSTNDTCGNCGGGCTSACDLGICGCTDSYGCGCNPDGLTITPDDCGVCNGSIFGTTSIDKAGGCCLSENIMCNNCCAPGSFEGGSGNCDSNDPYGLDCGMNCIDQYVFSCQAGQGLYYNQFGYCDNNGNYCDGSALDVFNLCCGTCHDTVHSPCGEDVDGCLYYNCNGSCTSRTPTLYPNCPQPSIKSSLLHTYKLGILPIPKNNNAIKNKLLAEINNFPLILQARASVSYKNGLYGKRYDLYFPFNGGANAFGTLARSTGTDSVHGDEEATVDFNHFTSSDRNLNPLNNYEYYSWQWLGYFKAPYTDTFTFSLASDDYSQMWIGELAVSGFNDTNKFTYQSNNNSVSLIGGHYYPIRIQFGEYTGADYITLSYSSSTESNISNFQGKFYHKTQQDFIAANPI